MQQSTAEEAVSMYRYDTIYRCWRWKISRYRPQEMHSSIVIPARGECVPGERYSRSFMIYLVLVRIPCLGHSDKDLVKV